MPIRASRFFNDPALAAGFQNISDMFAPPSGSDAHGYASAAAVKAEAERKAKMFAYANDPNYNREQADRYGVLADLYDPNASFYSVDQGNATTRRGQDITAGTVLATNAADNQQKTIASMFGPLNQGQVRPAVPETIAGMFELPALSAEQGLAPDLSETQWQAQQNERLRQSGRLSDADLLAAINSDIPVEQIVGPSGTPVIERRSDAVGRQPFINKGAEAKPTNGMAIVNGQRVAVIQGPDGAWKEAQTGASIPAGVEVFDMSKQEGAPGDFDATTANVTEANRLAATLDAADTSINRFEALLSNNPGVAGIPGDMMGLAQNAVQSLREITQTFGDKAPTAAVTLDEVRMGLEQFAPNYDPNIQRARTNAAELAYMWAQIQNPSGEVSRQAYERALDALTGGMLRNNASALAGLKGFRDAVSSARVKVERLRSPQAGAAAAAPAAIAARPRAVNPETGQTVEWDGQAWVLVQ